MKIEVNKAPLGKELAEVISKDIHARNLTARDESLVSFFLSAGVLTKEVWGRPSKREELAEGGEAYKRPLCRWVESCYSNSS